MPRTTTNDVEPRGPIYRTPGDYQSQTEAEKSRIQQDITLDDLANRDFGKITETPSQKAGAEMLQNIHDKRMADESKAQAEMQAASKPKQSTFKTLIKKAKKKK
jgi:hypothetical protein